MAYEFISPAECLGDSLYKINNNASDFDQRIIALTNVVASLSTALIAADVALTQAVLSAAPVGAVQSFAMATAPNGWLECNGVTVPNGSGTIQGKTANFTALYNAVGTTYGTVGTIPNLRGEFIRGWDNSRGIDSGRTFGSNQADAFQGHWHSLTNNSSVWRNTGGSVIGGTGITQAYTLEVREPTSDGTNGAPRTASETRPRNVSLLYCIKY
jgi:microcystin-dependent protein